MKFGRILLLVGLVVGLLLSTVATGIAGEGEGEVKIGYVYTDDDGNQSLNRETYNEYEGIGFSLSNFQYLAGNGLHLNADLENITLNNRNLGFSTYKPGLFKLTVNNNQYRRVYDEEGGAFTRRRSTGVQAEISPVKQFRVFGGYSQTDKKGEEISAFSEGVEGLLNETDYSYKSFNVGGQGFCPYGNLRVEYRHSDFADELSEVNDRKSDIISLAGYSVVPKYRSISVSGGFNYRQDEMETEAVKLKTYQGWGGTKIKLPMQATLDYRILYARSKNETRKIETDNWINTVALSRNWMRRGGIRVGFESRVADDLVDRTESVGFLAGGWYNVKDVLHLKGETSLRSKEVKTGTTLVGDEDYTKYLVSAKYVGGAWGDLSARYYGRVRKNDDINSQVDYTALSSVLNLKQPKYGSLRVVYSYYLGKYENLSDEVGYEFADHVVSASVHPVEYSKLSLSIGGSYYISDKDQDISKLTLDLGGIYRLGHGHDLEVRYQMYDYEDQLVTDGEFTGNTVEVSLVKHLSL